MSTCSCWRSWKIAHTFYAATVDADADAVGSLISTTPPHGTERAPATCTSGATTATRQWPTRGTPPAVSQQQLSKLLAGVIPDCCDTRLQLALTQTTCVAKSADSPLLGRDCIPQCHENGAVQLLTMAACKDYGCNSMLMVHACNKMTQDRAGMLLYTQL
jgi:hypothetical protein